MTNPEQQPAAEGSQSPMQDHGKIDLVSIDEARARIVLSLIETRPWGDRGENVRDMHEKINSYINYVLGGKLANDYPQNADWRVVFRLHASQPLGVREEKYILTLREKFLNARNIEWETAVL